jgi:hypothetical protein
MHIKFHSKILNGEVHLEDLAVNEREIFKKTGCEAADKLAVQDRSRGGL